jgi:multidrug efflux pump subunit AcrB
MRAPTGTRIEETARLADQVEAAIRELVPPDQLETILDNLGVPNSGINLSYSNAGTIGTFDGEMLLSLKEGHKPTDHFVSMLRAELPKRFPGIEFFFQPADIVTQILNFGLPAAIDVQFTGNDMAGNALRAAELTKAIRQIPGAVDAHVHQRLDGPALSLQMDRTRLQQYGPVGAERRPERADRAVGQLADGAGLLAESAERRGLQHRGADAAVQVDSLDRC